MLITIISKTQNSTEAPAPAQAPESPTAPTRASEQTLAPAPTQPTLYYSTAGGDLCT